MKSFCIALLLVNSFAALMATGPCGDLLTQVDITILPNIPTYYDPDTGEATVWTTMCYLKADDEAHKDTECHDLLQNSFVGGDFYDLLMRKGGDMGCYPATSFHASEMYRACRTTSNLMTKLSDNPDNVMMVVCIRYFGGSPMALEEK